MKTKRNDLVTAHAREAAQSLAAFGPVEKNAKAILDAALASDKTGVAWEIHLSGTGVQGVLKTSNGLLKIEG